MVGKIKLSLKTVTTSHPKKIILLLFISLKFNHPYFSNLTEFYPNNSKNQKQSRQSPKGTANENILFEL